MRFEESLPLSGFYTDLDTLFDMRFATLMQHWGDAEVQRILDAGYHTRASDFFKFINVGKFQKLYAERDMETMKFAVITPVMKMIKEFVANSIVNIATTPFHMQPKLYVNIHPYKLSKKDKDVLVYTLQYETDGYAVVELVDFPITELDPAFINFHLSTMALYHYKDWIDHFTNTGRFWEVTSPAVAMFSPQINMKDREALTPDVFNAIRELARFYIDLHLLPVSDFSIVLKR